MRKTILIKCLFLLGIRLFAQSGGAQRPVVFVHGFLASGDTYANVVEGLMSRLYPQEKLFVFDWNSVSGNGKRNDSLLAVFIDNILKNTRSAQIDLVGHSAGGMLARGYLVNSVHASKVAHYVHLGSRKWFTELPSFPNNRCLNIYSSADMVMGKSGGEVEGAVNLDLKDKDHYQVATCNETQQAMYNFFLDDKPPTDTYAMFMEYEAEGKAVWLGDNTPISKAIVKVYRVNPETGIRLSAKPVATFLTSNDGKWGSFRVSAIRKYYYEIELTPPGKGQRIVSYFIEPVKHPTKLIYLRGLPATGVVNKMLGELPAKDNESILIIYSASQALIAGRDSVTVNDVMLTSATLAPASKTLISCFIYDDGDSQTSGQALKQYKGAPFIGGVDVHLPVSTQKGHTVFYNGRSMVLPAKSSKERILLAVFN